MPTQSTTLSRFFARLCVGGGLLLLVASGRVQGAGVAPVRTTVPVEGRTVAVTGVAVDLADPTLAIKVGLAWDHIGRTEPLAGIAARAGALAAINGSFFNAYTQDALKNPDMSLITGGHLVFKSGLGSLLGFTADNTPLIGCLRHRLGGTLRAPDGKEMAWFAYWLNRKPTSATSVTIFTRHWGETIPAVPGVSVVVAGGTVVRLTEDVAAIPADGFVIHLRGEPGLQARFRVGQTITFTPEVAYKDGAGTPTAWTAVTEAVGGGPQVLRGGVPVFNPQGEDFSDPKILELRARRSAVGFTAARRLFLITVDNVRVRDLGPILKALGCTEGMNLDGGASSGLWYQGRYLTTPGRPISNALLIVPRR
jgi:hypothetical protein